MIYCKRKNELEVKVNERGLNKVQRGNELIVKLIDVSN